MESFETASGPVSVEVDLVEREYLAAVQAANRRLLARDVWRGWQGFGKALLIWLAIGSFAGYAVHSAQFYEVLPWLIFLGVGLLLFAVFWQRKRMYRRLLDGQAASFQIKLENEGLRVSNERGEFIYRWNAVELIETCAGGLHVHMRGFQVLWIPERCFADAAAFAAFLAELQAGSGLTLNAAPEPKSGFESCTSWPADLRNNILAGFKFLLLRSDALVHLRSNVEQFVMLAGLAVFASLFVDVARVGGSGQINWPALPEVFYGNLLILFAAWGASRAEPEAGGRLLPAAIALSTIWLLIDLLAGGLDLLPGRDLNAYSPVGWLLRLALLLWGALASIVALVRVLGLLPESRLAAVLATVYLLLLPSFLIGDQGHLWVKNYSGDETADSRRRWQAATREAVLYAQPRLLDAALARVEAGKPGVAELFFLGVAGYGEQDVFQREVTAVARQFDARFQTAGRGILLINNPASVLERPVASVTALRQSLKVIGKRMNPEDVLFLFMTSHGSDKHRFDLSLWPFRFDDLTPQVLRQMLDEAGIRYRVVLVSACYSGGFVQPLSSPDTLVITAARADRNSHGCSHEAEWTFFGKAYFDEALMQTASFTEAFNLARGKVAEREKAEGLEASEPQMAAGQGIQRALQVLEKRHPLSRVN